MQSAAAISSFLVSPPLPFHVGGYRSPWHRTSPLPSSWAPYAGGIVKYSPSLQWRFRAISKNKDMGSDLQQNIAQPILDRGKPYPGLADVQTGGKEEPVHLGERIREIKEKLASMAMGDGDVNISPYDTAWVALIPNINDNEGPHFPLSLQWIIDHQLDDGSWGDARHFNAYDRLLNTLGCVIALKTWETYSDHSARGIEFLQANMHKLGDENLEHMLAGFEVLFPSLLDMARSLSVDIPYDTPALLVTKARRDEKLKRIPLDVLHNVPTTLLYSLEGMTNKLDWNKLLKLRCTDGSFFYSPSSTAYAVMKTKDKSCLEYLEKTVSQFNGGVPFAYPVDIFERIWVVDRLQRLGISRYFKDEIKQSVEYVYKYWTEIGLGWGRNSPIPDIDDTAMGFRILRQHGYNVTADAFKNFLRGDEFVCFARESDPSVTAMYNLNRASQVAFPGEKILEDAKSFTYRFLRETQAKNELLDKWLITKDLPGEISYCLDFPWLMSLPLVEARTYLEQYSGDDDVWIAKTLYRIYSVSSNTYLDFAKADFNRCQVLLQEEWINLRRWFIQHELAQYGVSIQRLLEIYFLAASIVFEPERSNERFNWAQSAMLTEAIYSYIYQNRDNMLLSKISEEFKNSIIESTRSSKDQNTLTKVLVKTIENISIKTNILKEQKVHITSHDHLKTTQSQQLIRQKLQQLWFEWMANTVDKGFVNSHEEDALLFIRTLEICDGRFGLEDALLYSSMKVASNDDYLENHKEDNHNMRLQEYIQLTNVTKSICRILHQKKNSLGQQGFEPSEMNTSLESNVQKLTKIILDSHSLVDVNTRQTFLQITKSFYYSSHCPPSTMNFHIGKVLFERVQ